MDRGDPAARQNTTGADPEPIGTMPEPDAIMALGLESLMQVKENYQNKVSGDFGVDSRKQFDLVMRLSEIHDHQNDLLAAQLKLDSTAGAEPGKDDDDHFEAFRDRITAIDELTAQLGEVTSSVDALFTEVADTNSKPSRATQGSF